MRRGNLFISRMRIPFWETKSENCTTVLTVYTTYTVTVYIVFPADSMRRIKSAIYDAYFPAGLVVELVSTKLFLHAVPLLCA